MIKVLQKILGSPSERANKKLWPLVRQINQFEESLQSLSDDELREKTTRWREHLSQIEDKEALAKELEQVMPEAFAVVKNACRRLLGTQFSVRGQATEWDMVPFDVQLLGAIALHRGKIAEMATGEGKTLVATLPMYLNALTGRGVHLVTVNDYLAARDSEWMGLVFRFLGLTVGCIQHDQSPQSRREQYECDITYGTNSEFGFDYLRDNGMASRAQEQVQRGHYYCIVDEVDSILIDEARTPLIISGPAVVESDNTLYEQYKPQVAQLVHEQNRLCERFLKDAKKLISKLEASEGSMESGEQQEMERQIGRLLFRVKTGTPKSSDLLNLLEKPKYYKMMNNAELELHADQTKRELYEEKEQLYFAIDEKGNDADLTEQGRSFLSPNDPEAFMLPDLATALHEVDVRTDMEPKEKLEAKTKLQQDFENKAQQIHIISQLLKAYCLYERDVQYVVQENKVIIVDEHTGRLMPGRRWSDGLHQAVEAKEGATIEKETQTLASITLQNYFRLYQKLAGMTGTAETEAAEFEDIYQLGVQVVPTNKPVQRTDYNDSVYKTKREKYNAVLSEIQEIHRQGRPILVGTISVDASEHLSKMLKRAGIVHSVLNAKYHQYEAEIIARAGQRGAVTIATNMAGRGTDIKLGEAVADLGGLHVMGTERHESRRIDRQLRGRCARQGDPGSTHFYISLEDDVMRLFGSDKIIKYMERVGLEEGQELEHPLLNRSIESAQKRVEQHNFQIRKRTLEYDDVMNKQREVIYGYRNDIIHSENVHDRLMEVLEEVVIQKVNEHTGEEEIDEWDLHGLSEWLNHNFPLGITEEELTNKAWEGEKEGESPPKDSAFDGLSRAQYSLCRYAIKTVQEAYELKASFEEPEALKSIERYTILSAIDKLWQEHLYNMDTLRTSISLRAYGQRDPLLEYKAEAFKMFEELTNNINLEICHNIFRSASSLMAFEQFLHELPQSNVHQRSSAFTQSLSGNAAAAATGERSSSGASEKASTLVSEANQAVAKTKPTRAGPKVGRNEPCPCGSGKKYKRCCGAS